MTTTIRPPKLDRVLNVIVMGPVFMGTGVAIALAATSPDASARVFLAVRGAVFVATGIWLTSRLPRVSVQLLDDELRYDGFLVSWTLPREGITAVLDDAWVEWRDPAGRERRRQIGLLTRAWEDDGTKFAPYWRWRREALLQVREWATGPGH
ncbi:hypothetical protein ITJ54_12270 [Curtobacterium sp. VKM Ac-2865]|uniref:hypothetical protein n=1 Tax=Curtobacterium sp. VKM Ac-2865 TaxID=2783817 RepID=UPI00188AC1C2|nr:hypothetical protein [Curtobacterium sp. VKM Ac-2865]MBF4583443.1 hypothetical protein [Curtobacterium sp. VKM Ac-2865]